MVEAFVGTKADATTAKTSPDTNFGSGATNEVALQSHFDMIKNIYLKFAIPDVNITAASFRVHIHDTFPLAGGRILLANSRDSSWTETGITYNNAPKTDFDLNIPREFGSAKGAWIEVDITAFAKDYEGRDVTIILLADQDGPWYYLDAKNSSNPPNLMITHTEAPPPKSTAHFTSEPSGAEVWWDGTKRYVTPQTISFETSAIVKQATYKLSGYEDITFDVNVQLGEEKTYHKVMTPIVGPPEKGYIRGKVTHSLLGTPLALVTVKWGAYSRTTDSNGDYVIMLEEGFSQPLEASFPGFEDYSTPITAGPGDDITHNIALVPTVTPPEQGTVQLNSVPQGAKIFIDGADIGEVGPYSFTSAPKDYLIRMELEGYSTEEGTLNLTEGSNPPFTLTLTLIVADPWWERITRFDEDGNLVFSDETVAAHDLGPWLEDHYLDKPLGAAAKAAFLAVVVAASGAIMWQVIASLGAAVAARFGTHIIRDLPRDSAVIVEQMIDKAVPPATLAANPIVSKLMEIFGAKTPLRLIGMFAAAVAGIDIIATWLASDNVVTGTGFTINRLKNAVEAGTITSEQALDDLQQVQGWKDYATNFIEVSTIANPLLWAFRSVFLTNTDLAQKNIDDIRAEIEALEPGVGTAWVLVSSNPIGAGIYIDGEYKFIKTDFQFLLHERAQPYFIQIAAPSGYKNPTGRSVTIAAGVNQTLDFGDLISLEPGETPEPFVPVPIEVPIIPKPPPEVKYTAWKYTITARDTETGKIVGAKIIINGTFTDKYTTNFVILEPSATYSLRLEAYGYEPAEIMITTEALPT